MYRNKGTITVFLSLISMLFLVPFLYDGRIGKGAGSEISGSGSF